MFAVDVTHLTNQEPEQVGVSERVLLLLSKLKSKTSLETDAHL